MRSPAGRGGPPRPSVARALDAVAALDGAVAAQVARTDSAALDQAMRLLSEAADHSKLWAALATGMGLSGRPGLRRGAALGLASGALSSLVVNQGLKRAVPRHRPTPESVEVRRRLRRVPGSSSFPSGHAASAATFATGAAMREPGSLVVLGPLAVAVGFSRMHSGVHHASDVVVGAAVGAGVARLAGRVGAPKSSGSA